MRFLGGFFRVFFLLRTGISTRPPTFFPNGYPKMMDGRMKIYMFNFRWLNWKLNLFSWCFGSLGSQRITWQKHRETLYPSNSKPPWAKISVHFFFWKGDRVFLYKHTNEAAQSMDKKTKEVQYSARNHGRYYYPISY